MLCKQEGDSVDFSKVKETLESLGYKVSCFETSSAAGDYLNGQIDGETVGFGGSVTLDEMGLYDSLRAHNTVYWHSRASKALSAAELRGRANAADIYISSVNAIAETGEIINIDGNCNRVAAVFYGHKKVYLVAGKNKIEKDYDSALFRARNIAAPKNAKRLGAKTPCAERADRCYNCKSPERICRGLSVLWAPPMLGEYEVILINEALGY